MITVGSIYSLEHHRTFQGETLPPDALFAGPDGNLTS
jgi:hypothetical protein